MSMSNVTNIYRNALLEKINMGREIVRAEGSYLHDSDGNVIVDCLAQYGAVPFGHNPVFIQKSIAEYFQHQGPGFVQPFFTTSVKKLSQRLCGMVGDSYRFVVFTSTGTETVEAAIKLARLNTKREKILSNINSFHGKTYSALSATGSEKYADNLIVDRVNYNKVEFNDIKMLEISLSTKEYAAFIVEPVQGEGGMIEAAPEYMKAAQELCKKYGTLLIADEIQTGIGRTGYLLASHKYDIEPDMVLLSKALGGGVYPIGAVVVKKGAYSKDFDKKHSSTFANGGLGAQIANAVLDQLDQGSTILDEVNNKEAYIKKRLEAMTQRYNEIFSFSGTGLMYALRFKDDYSFNNYIVSFCQNRDVLSYIICGYLLTEKKYLCMPFLGDAYGAIRFEPSLTIDYPLIDGFLESIEEVCKIIKSRRYDILMSYLVGRKIDVVDIPSLIETESAKDILQSEYAYSDEKKSPRFAFLMHATSSADVVRGLPRAVRDHFEITEQYALAEWMMEFGNIDPTPERTIHVTMRSQTGKVVEGILIFSPMRPEDMMKLSSDEKKRLINDYLDVAEREQVDVVGLGAFTSVVSRAGTDIDRKDFRLTTGNSFTAMATAEAIKHSMGSEIGRKSLMVVGARGSVGRLAFMELSRYFNNIYLVGSGRSGVRPLYETIASALVELIDADVDAKKDSALQRFKTLLHLMDLSASDVIERIRNEGGNYLLEVIEKGKSLGLAFPFEVSIDINDFISRSDCVISVTSEGKPFIKSNIFKPGTQVFDTARPFDIICNEDEKFTGVKVFEGGLVEQPEEIMFGDCNMIGSKAGVNLACLSETIAITMEGGSRNYSLGQTIPYLEAREVFALATKHGFSHFVGSNAYPVTAI